jgi:hypothetical protein
LSCSYFLASSCSYLSLTLSVSFHSVYTLFCHNSSLSSFFSYLIITFSFFHIISFLLSRLLLFQSLSFPLSFSFHYFYTTFCHNAFFIRQFYFCLILTFPFFHILPFLLHCFLLFLSLSLSPYLCLFSLCLYTFLSQHFIRQVFSLSNSHFLFLPYSPVLTFLLVPFPIALSLSPSLSLFTLFIHFFVTMLY